MCDPVTWVTELSGDMGDRLRGMVMEGTMPWDVRSRLGSKLRFIVEWLEGELSMAELCRQHGVSRQTGYELVSRFEASGIDGVKPRSRAPHHHPNAVPAPLAEAVLELRRAHPSRRAVGALGQPGKRRARLFFRARLADPGTRARSLR